MESWFRPFGSVAETCYLQSGRAPSSSAEVEAALVKAQPGGGRISGSSPGDQMAATWIYYVDAASPGGAMEEVRRRFPEGSDNAGQEGRVGKESGVGSSVCVIILTN